MKLTREELKGISAGAEAVEYPVWLVKLVAIITAFLDKLNNYFNPGE